MIITRSKKLSVPSCFYPTILPTLLCVVALSGCSQTSPCEDIVEVNRQLHVCKSLSKVMNDNRYPQQAISAKKRYETECEDFRYYRDDYDTICKGSQQAIGNRL
ncbi:hypothetical protein Q4561_02570 [Alteromonas sp. 1_MG-2023]|uniref:hypothetical protein n=1 Tax=Alteromonas sp. 1_MG-2023 TaxID=3062669 RepID=UPI0026E242AF|nr:hypothetical protein [Alteromonas sp. 1_MG-2023]MDO6565933.1 hypothetical protein [Alteromonas sp. 1_MG-2023]